MRKPALLLLIFILAGCQNEAATPTTVEYQPGIRSYDRTMLRLMKNWGVPGGFLAIIEDGEILLSHGYEYADVGQKEAVQPGSLFRNASVSKPLTAVAVLKLVEEGKLQLDMPALRVLDHLHPADGVEIDPRLESITT